MSSADPLLVVANPDEEEDLIEFDDDDEEKEEDPLLTVSSAPAPTLPAPVVVTPPTPAPAPVVVTPPTPAPTPVVVTPTPTPPTPVVVTPTPTPPTPPVPVVVTPTPTPPAPVVVTPTPTPAPPVPVVTEEKKTILDDSLRNQISLHVTAIVSTNMTKFMEAVANKFSIFDKETLFEIWAEILKDVNAGMSTSGKGTHAPAAGGSGTSRVSPIITSTGGKSGGSCPHIIVGGVRNGKACGDPIDEGFPMCSRHSAQAGIKGPSSRPTSIQVTKDVSIHPRGTASPSEEKASSPPSGSALEEYNKVNIVITSSTLPILKDIAKREGVNIKNMNKAPIQDALRNHFKAKFGVP